MQYVQAITSKVSLGGEVVYQKSPIIPAGSTLGVTAAARYSGEFYIYTFLFFKWAIYTANWIH